MSPFSLRNPQSSPTNLVTTQFYDSTALLGPILDVPLHNSGMKPIMVGKHCARPDVPIWPPFGPIWLPKEVDHNVCKDHYKPAPEPLGYEGEFICGCHRLPGGSAYRCANTVTLAQSFQARPHTFHKVYYFSPLISSKF